MLDGSFLQRFVEFSQELFPCISDDLVDTNREQPGCTAEEVPDVITIKRRYGQCQSLVAVFVEHDNDITA